jgi:hypothetical protein
LSASIILYGESQKYKAQPMYLFVILNNDRTPQDIIS